MATPRIIVDDKQIQTDAWSDIDPAQVGELFEEFQIQLSAALDNIRAADVEDAFGQFSLGAASQVSVMAAQVKATKAVSTEIAIPVIAAPEKTAPATPRIQRQPDIIPLQTLERSPWIVYGLVTLLIIVCLISINRFSQSVPSRSNKSSKVLSQSDVAKLHAESGDKLAAQNEWAQAAQEHGEAAQFEPDNARRHSKLGNDLSRSRNYAGAVEAYRKAVNLEPNNAQMHSDLGKALIWTNKWAEAAKEHETAVRLEPDNAQWHNNLGVDLMWMNERAKAEAEYREAIRLDPQNLEYQNNFKTMEYLTSRPSIVAH